MFNYFNILLQLTFLTPVFRLLCHRKVLYNYEQILNILYGLSDSNNKFQKHELFFSS